MSGYTHEHTSIAASLHDTGNQSYRVTTAEMGRAAGGLDTPKTNEEDIANDGSK
jgi:hypothetical protein